MTLQPLDDWAAFLRATNAAEETIRLRTLTLRGATARAGKTCPADLDRRDVIRYLARPELQPWSRVTYWRVFSAWDRWAREFGLIEASIMRGVPRPKVPRPVARPISDRDVSRLLASRLSLRARSYVLLALYAGLRVHEVAKIKGEDLDVAAGWLTVCGKGNVTKPVPLHPEIAALATKYPVSGYWFPSPGHPGEHVDPEWVSQLIRQSMLAVGIDATAHRLRDTAATKLQRTVHDLRVTQTFLRHADISTTQKYVAVADDDMREAVSRLDWANIDAPCIIAA